MNMGKFSLPFTGGRNKIAIALIGVCGVIATTATIIQPSYANQPDFYCGSTTYQGKPVPATWARRRSGAKVLMIRWLRTVGEYSAWDRCQLVSRRFQSFYDQGKLHYIKGEFVNKQPVLCAVTKPWEPCTRSNTLFTLHPRWFNSPQAAAEQLLNQRGLASSRVLNESDSKTLYIDFQEYLDAAE